MKQDKITTNGLKQPSLSAIQSTSKIIEAGTICYAPQLEIGSSYKVIDKEEREDRNGRKFFVTKFRKL